jgi:excisionase family DNA binding protein
MILTIKDIMETLHIGRTTAYKLIENGELKAAKIAGKYRTTRTAIYEYLEKAMATDFQKKQPAWYNHLDCFNGTREIPSAERSGYSNSAERNQQ